MLEAMRELALDFLHAQLGGGDVESLEAFYDRVRQTAEDQLLSYLVGN
jgi:hypothetical protein